LARALTDLVARKYANIDSEQTKDFKLLPQKLGDVQLGLAGAMIQQPDAVVRILFSGRTCSCDHDFSLPELHQSFCCPCLNTCQKNRVRKVTGALRKNLVIQFLSESIITSLFALGMAILLLLFLVPAFKGLWVNKYLNFELPSMPSVYLVFTGFALLIGIIAGIYPALYLSKYQPIKALKNLNNVNAGKLGMRKALGISQFVISLFFITTSILIYNQFKHYLSFDYGFSSKTLSILNYGVDYHFNELRDVAGVTTISASDLILQREPIMETR
jgi:putative ABC transport system permease protein